VLAGFRKASGGTVRIDGQPVFENPGITRQVCLIRGTSDVGDRDERVGEALYTASRLRPGWDGDYADALGPVALQDLFVHLTQPSGGPR
jgi:ABC-2 type transport system ATP-binding protein